MTTAQGLGVLRATAFLCYTEGKGAAGAAKAGHLRIGDSAWRSYDQPRKRRQDVPLRRNGGPPVWQSAEWQKIIWHPAAECQSLCLSPPSQRPNGCRCLSRRSSASFTEGREGPLPIVHENESTGRLVPLAGRECRSGASGAKYGSSNQGPLPGPSGSSRDRVPRRPPTCRRPCGSGPA